MVPFAILFLAPLGLPGKGSPTAENGDDAASSIRFTHANVRAHGRYAPTARGRFGVYACKQSVNPNFNHR